MQWKVFTVPVVLLALLCTACNGRYEKAKLRVKTPVASAMAADSSRAVGVADVQQEAVNDNEARFTAPKVVADDEQKEEDAPPSPDQSYYQRKAGAPPPAPAPDADWDRRIVKTADLTLKVKDFRLFTNRLHAAVKQSGGYIAQEQLSQSAGEIENIVTIKVPVDRFELLMGEMPGDSDKLEEKKISSEDVTMELVDTKSHLQTKKAVREQYRELLKQARSMKDIIAIQGEIDGIQEEMDEAAGRVAYLDHSSAYSTINLKFYQVLDEAVHEEQAPGFAERLKEAIRDGWGGLSSFMLGLISVWPLCLLVGVVVVVARKKLKRVPVKVSN
ncbi:MAG TPA: DUF4349 domain-containing protein [Puia sp.]|nr:DUF4349 domain-containing protein [Puia sp.]